MKKKSLKLLLIVAMVLILSLSLLACKDKDVNVTGVTLSKANLTLNLGAEYSLKATVEPDNAANQEVKWSSSNPDVATVSATGVVKALMVGKTAIKVTTADGGFSATCNVEVSTKTAPAIVWPTYSGGDTLVVGYSPFSSKFSPFFAKTGYDQDVASMTQISLLTLDRNGNIIFDAIDGETVAYEGTDHLYTGVANISIDKKSNETVYNIELKDDLFFSDGTHLTIDDVIFSMYVLSDPNYTGSSTLYSTKIKGMNSYRTNDIDKTEDAIAFLAAVEDIIGRLKDEEEITAEEQDMLDWCIDATLTVSSFSWAYADYSADDLRGFGFEGDTDEEVYRALAESEVVYGFEDYIEDLTAKKALELAAKEAASTGKIVKTIEGIKKTGPYSMTVTTDGFEATTIYQLGVSIAPLHYYGDVALYNYNESKFGFEKGNLAAVEAKTTKPMGAGPYKFVKFENGVVYFERNGYYFKGAPKIKNIQFRETTDDSDKISGLQSGTFDITDPSFNKAAIQEIKGYNSNGELNGNVIETSLVDNLGYGYIGINADRVKVGNDSASEASKNLRKAYATVFAVYREVVIDSYYGEIASVIEYPISNTSWAAPKPVDEGFEIAYSTDKDGMPIYTANMTAQEKYAIAISVARDFFEAAGYEVVGGKVVGVPARVAHIPADGKGEHPSFAILTYAKEALDTIGVELNIQDYSNSAQFWPALEGNQCDIWCAAWGATVDPDMYQVYHSTNAIGAGGTDSNHYNIKDDTLDEMIIDARGSADQAYRKALYKQCLETIMDWAVEVPTYQRKNAIIFSTARVNLETLTPDITTFWGWMNDIELLEMN